MQNDVGTFNGCPRARDAYAFDFTISLRIIADTCGVDDVDRYTFNLYRFSDFVARRSCNSGHNGNV